MKNLFSTTQKGIKKANKVKKAALIAAVAFLLSTQLYAQGGTTGPLTWNLEDGVLTISGTGAMPNYNAGESPWYSYFIKTVIIEDGVTSIGEWAFYYCSSLTSITIPNSVTSIGYWAFSSCSSLTSITIPNGVTSIGAHAFSYCSSLTSITIPNSVTSIEFFAFSHCSSLTSIHVAEDNSNYSSKDGVLFNKDKTVLIACPGGKEGVYIIPDGVTSIERSAFSYCSSLTSITIPNSVTSIGRVTFSGCSSLKSIHVTEDNSNYSSKDGVLFNKDKTVLIACPGGKEGGYIIPDGVTRIEDSAFSNCSSLTSITIPNGVTSVGLSAFFYCSSLTSITIPNGVTRIEGSAFYDCSSLTSITIPNSVTSIGTSAFSNCSSLTSITIPNSVTSIGTSAFSNCSSLTEITNLNSVPQEIGSEVFHGVSQASCMLIVRNAAVEAYKAADIWRDFDIVGGGYAVVVSSNNVAYGFVDGDGLYEANAAAILTATANSGYEFENWSVDGAVVSTENPYSFAVTSDIAITANFKMEGYIVAAYPNNIACGSVDGDGFYAVNATAILTATANSGYEFENWSVDGAVVSTENPYSFTVTGDIELVANFKSDGTSIDEMKKEFAEIVVFPNPATNQIVVSAQECTIKQLTLFNQSGQQIAQTTASEINLENFPAGLYILHVKTDKGNVARKVVKQ